MNEWMKKGMVTDVVDQNNKVISRNEEWAFGVRVVGNYNKKK